MEATRIMAYMCVYYQFAIPAMMRSCRQTGGATLRPIKGRKGPMFYDEVYIGALANSRGR